MTSTLSPLSATTSRATASTSDLGLATPQSVADASAAEEKFSATVSAEQLDMSDDVDIILLSLVWHLSALQLGDDTASPSACDWS